MKRATALLSALTLVGITAAGTPALADPPAFDQIKTLTPTVPGGFFGDDYGQVVDIQGDYMFVAAPVAIPDPSFGKTTEGAIYVYKRSGGGWANATNTQIITTGGRGDHFGASSMKAVRDWLFVAAVGTPIPTGPIGDDPLVNQDFTGSVRAYHREGGQYVYKQSIDRSTPGLEDLTVIDPGHISGSPPPAQAAQLGAGLGVSFDLTDDGQRLLVGAATQKHGTNINAGSVFSLKLVNGVWVHEQTLTDPTGIVTNGTFGGRIAIDGRYAIVSTSSFFTDALLTTPHTNYVYLYRFDNGQWNYLDKVQGDQTNTIPLNAPTEGGTVNMPDNFGASLSFDEGWALIGAPTANLGTSAPRGAAFFFKLEGVGNNAHLVFKQKVTSDEADISKVFLTGINVSLDNRTALVSAPTRTGPSGATAQGAVMAFRRQGNTWVKEANLFDSNGAAYEVFSKGLAADGDTIVGGSGTAVTRLHLRFFFDPPLMPDMPFTAPAAKVVIWDRDN